MPFAKAWYRAGPTADVDSIPIPDDITDEFLALYRVGRVVVRPKKEAKDVVIKEHVEKIERLVMDWWELGLEGDEVGGGEEKERRDVEMKVLFERLFSALTEHQESDSDVVVADEKETGTAGRPSGSVSVHLRLSSVKRFVWYYTSNTLTGSGHHFEVYSPTDNRYPLQSRFDIPLHHLPLGPYPLPRRARVCGTSPKLGSLRCSRIQRRFGR